GAFIGCSAFFATNRSSGMSFNDNQRKQLIKWFWKSNFSRRYSAAIQDRHKQDIALMKELVLVDTTLIAELAGATIRTGGYYTVLKSLFQFAGDSVK
ncbi:MAG: hypothetical protein CVV61_04005, partial [Tenericutes bacterium HGW-Tenericutes-6]